MSFTEMEPRECFKLRKDKVRLVIWKDHFGGSLEDGLGRPGLQAKGGRETTVSRRGPVVGRTTEGAVGMRRRRFESCNRTSDCKWGNPG